MGASGDAEKINIPSIFIGNKDGLKLLDYLERKEDVALILNLEEHKVDNHLEIILDPTSITHSYSFMAKFAEKMKN